MPVVVRGGIDTSSSSPASPMPRPPLLKLCLALNAVTTAAASCWIVFHSLQSAHCPAQRGLTAPHDWQT